MAVKREIVINERHNVAFLVGILIGALGSALAGLLLTPLSGRETRRQLAARIDEARGIEGGRGDVKRISSSGVDRIDAAEVERRANTTVTSITSSGVARVDSASSARGGETGDRATGGAN